MTRPTSKWPASGRVLSRCQLSQTAGVKDVKCTYRENDGTLHIRLTDKAISREKSPNWHTNISYAEDGSIVEVVLLDFSKLGKWKRQLVKAADR